MLTLLATTTCTIKRASFSAGGRDPATAATVLTGLACTPVSAVDAGKRNLDEITEGVASAMETFILGAHDIRQNDIVVIGGVSYLATAVALWPTAAAMHCTLELVRQ